MIKIRDIRGLTGLSQAKFAEKYGIPTRTLENWEMGSRKAPDYLIKLLARIVLEDTKGSLVVDLESEFEKYRSISN